MRLSEFELELMQLFWEKSESTAPSIHHILKQKRPVSYSTVKTIIDRLEIKGALERKRQSGRTIWYSPLIEKQQYNKSLVKSFIDRVFLGNSRPLAAHILQSESLTVEDIQYLEKILKLRKQELK